MAWAKSVWSFGHDETVGRGVVDVAESLELAAGLLDGVQADGRVCEHRGGLAGDDVGRDLRLVLLDDLGDRLLAGVGAGLGLGGEVIDLDGALLDADVQAAGVVGVDLVRVAGLGHPLGAGVEVAHHVDLLLTVGVDGEAGDPDVELAGGDAEDDGVEAGRLPLGLEPELGGNGVEEVDVHALDGLAVGPEELVGGVGGVDADGDGALALERGGELGDEGWVGCRGGDPGGGSRAGTGRGARSQGGGATRGESERGRGDGGEHHGAVAEHEERSFHRKPPGSGRPGRG